jgi:hypothetical protein
MDHLGRSAQRTVAEQINFSPTVALQSNFQIPAFSEILVDSSVSLSPGITGFLNLNLSAPTN